MTPELETRIRQALANLSMLSEAPAGKAPELSPPSDLGQGRKAKRIRPGEWGMRSKSPARHNESSPPAGVRLDLDSNRQPPKERSLHDWYVWEFLRLLRADTPLPPRSRSYRTEPTVVEMMENLCEIAELEYQERRFHSPERTGIRSGALTENNMQDGGMAERTAGERIVEWYEGWSATKVAHRERTTEAWVKKERRRLKRNTHDGTPRSEFLELDEDGRRELALLTREQLRAEMRERGRIAPSRGAGVKIAADRLGVSKTLLLQYWPRDEELEAAA